MLRSQLLESQNRGRDHMAQGIQKQIGILPTIEAEAHLVQVGGEMLGANLVPRSHDAALQKREGGFHGVGRNPTATYALSLLSG